MFSTTNSLKKNCLSHLPYNSQLSIILSEVTLGIGRDLLCPDCFWDITFYHLTRFRLKTADYRLQAILTVIKCYHKNYYRAFTMIVNKKNEKLQFFFFFFYSDKFLQSYTFVIRILICVFAVRTISEQFSLFVSSIYFTRLYLKHWFNDHHRITNVQR